MASLTKLWKRVGTLLKDAAAALPHPDPDAGSEAADYAAFKEFFGHNELELAWDSLAAVAKKQRAGAGVWVPLVQSAALMELRAQEKRASKELLSSAQRFDASTRLVLLRKYRKP